jgi:hypothetical protein
MLTKYSDDEPRDEQGRWTDAGGGSDGGDDDSGSGYEFVSPNVGNLDFHGAVKALGSPRQGVLHDASDDINHQLDVQAKSHDIVGAWADGAENSVLDVIGKSDWDKMILAGSMKGYLADQKNVLVFQQRDQGDGVLAQFAAQGNLKEIHDKLLEDGLANHTLVPTATGATVYVADLDNTQSAAIEKAAQRYDADVQVHFGHGEFIGTDSYEGTDREQRDRARDVYQAHIDESPVQGSQEIWQGVRDRWGPKLAETDTAKSARRIYVRSHVLKAYDAITLAMAEGAAIVPYDGEHIPGTELIDPHEWEQRYDPSEPRDDEGKWTDSGGGDGGGEAGDGGGDVRGSDIGHGYSKDAVLKPDGKIHTSNVYDAARALYENRPVVLNQPRGVSVLIEHLGKVAKEMKALGGKAPNFNLCNVSVAGSNLFCADSKGVPRPEMPQLSPKQTKEFRRYLKDKGYKEQKLEERSDHLRATQNELNGAKVAKMAQQLRDDPDEKAKRLVVSKDNYILDGHHHWAAQIANDAEDNKLGGAKTRVARVNIDIIKLLEEAKKFGAATESENKRNEWSQRFDESEPRDEEGKWTDAGGGDGGGDATAGGAAPSSAHTDTEKQTLKAYTATEGSVKINKFMRADDKSKYSEKTRKELQTQVDTIRGAMKKNEIGKPGTVFRIIAPGKVAKDLDKNADKLVGQKLPLGGFQSTTTKWKDATNFARASAAHIAMVMELPAHTPVIDMTKYSQYKEHELLLDEGNFTVTKVERSDEGWVNIYGNYAARGA